MIMLIRFLFPYILSKKIYAVYLDSKTSRYCGVQIYSKNIGDSVIHVLYY